MLMFFIIIGVVVYFIIHSLLNEKFDNDMKKYHESLPTHIVNPATDLRTNQKYAVLRILAWVQGCSPLTAYGLCGDEISGRIFKSLGISKEDAAHVLQLDMRRDPEKVLQQIFNCLDEIRDRQYLRNLGHDLYRLAELSGDTESADALQSFFGQLLDEKG